MNEQNILREIFSDLCYLEGFNMQVTKNSEEFIAEIGKTNLKHIECIKIAITELINK